MSWSFDGSAWWNTLGASLSGGAVIVLGVVLVLLVIASWVLNALSLPGNWGIVLIGVLTALFVPATFTEQENARMLLDWPTVIGLLVLAIVGEILEGFAAAAGVAKQGASKRSMALSLVGTMAGSVAGVAVGVPVPIIGPLLGALLGGAVGAFAGAYFGEAWKGVANHDERVAVGSAAFSGKIAGTSAKILVGAIMCLAFAVSLVI